MAVINSRINEHHVRQNKKEYLNSFLHQRRQLEEKLDQGYKVVLNDVPDYNDRFLSSFNGQKDGVDSMDELDEQHQLETVPSHKLSTYIRRRNTMRRKKE